MRFAVFVLMIASSVLFAGDVPDDWAYHPMSQPVVPKDAKHPIDAFLLQKLTKAQLKYSPPASKTELLRRVSFDLTGLPPTPEECQAFEKDQSSSAYEKVVDRLLASPHFGERTAIWWLDLVRFAETDGFNADAHRPNAWRYRDYVIASFNSDLPYDRFIREQLAGDEVNPRTDSAMIATGFLRHFPDEHNAVNLEQRRQEILNDITDTTAATFLGITLGCAKCHDHKTDPIAQDDYYRMQAFFAGVWAIDHPIWTNEQKATYTNKLKEWEQRTAEIRRKMDELEAPSRDQAGRKQRSRFDDDYAKLLDIPFKQRTPIQKQLGEMIDRQVQTARKFNPSQLKGEAKAKWDMLAKELAKHAKEKPTEPQMIMAMTDVGVTAPEHHLLRRGNWQKPGHEVDPGYITSIDRNPAELKPTSQTTGRRTALANWIASPMNPLTARVMVNRIWQQLFGEGLVATGSDFGLTGEKPSHPELLDWLANDFVSDGWRIKRIYKQLVTSTAYRQTSRSDQGVEVDPDNRLLWRSPRKRIDGETLRDAMLAIAGTLNRTAGGPSVFPPLPAELKAPASWKVSSKVEDQNRKSIYVYVKRNLRYPLFTLFDAPDRNETCPRRFVTTTAPQSLMLVNDTIILEIAQSFAGRIRKEAGEDLAKQHERIYQLALARTPNELEAKALLNFRKQHGGSSEESLFDLCHAVLNLNEFVYID